jgi:hypothetical protein
MSGAKYSNQIYICLKASVLIAQFLSLNIIWLFKNYFPITDFWLTISLHVTASAFVV